MLINMGRQGVQPDVDPTTAPMALHVAGDVAGGARKLVARKVGHSDDALASAPAVHWTCTAPESCADVGISSTLSCDALVSRASGQIDDLLVVGREAVVIQLFLGEGHD